MRLSVSKPLVLAAVLTVTFVPSASALVSDAGMFNLLPPLFAPEDPGARVSFQWDFMDEGQNWSGSDLAPARDNLNKDLTTNWLKAGVQFQFDKFWGVRTEVPLGVRFLTTPSQGNGNETFTRVGLGDVQVLGEFSGLTSDRSTTIRAGVKLPTGPATDKVYGPSYRLGTGSTDLLLGIDHFGQLGQWDRWVWTMEFLWRQPLLTQNSFVPGAEIDQAFGITYRNLYLDDVLVVPLVQLVTSYRWGDRLTSNGGTDTTTGATDSVFTNSGSTVYALAPGLGVEWDAWRGVLNLGIPLYQSVNGNQLVAPFALQTQISYGF